VSNGLQKELSKLVARRTFLLSCLKQNEAGSDEHERLSLDIRNLNEDIDQIEKVAKVSGTKITASDMKDEAGRILKEARRDAKGKGKEVIEDQMGLGKDVIKPVVKTPEDVDEARLYVDFEYFCEKCLKIKYRPGLNPDFPEGGSGPFLLNENQKRLVAVMITIMLVQRKPLRMQVLKSRQLGNTTILLAFALWLALTLGDFHVMLIIDKKPHNRTKRGMVIGWIDHIAETFACFKDCGIVRGGRGENQVDLGNGSIFFFESAESPNPGTSEMLHMLIESEKPKWPAGRADQIKTSILPGIPKAPMTAHIDESTAEGVGPFKRKWDRNVSAKPGESDVIPIFFPWTISKEYAEEPEPEHFDKRGRFIYFDQDDEVSDWDDETDGLIPESDYAKKYDLSKAQVLFRRVKIKTDYEGNRSNFDQEYPTTPAHAFRRFQSQFFSQRLMKWVELNSDRTITPFYRGNLVCQAGNQDVSRPVLYTEVKPIFRDEPRGDFYIRNLPVPGETYYLGVDTAEGKVVLDEKGRDDPDYTIFTMKDSSGHTQAYYISRIRPEHAWLNLLLFAIWYNMAWVNGERNNTGLTLLAMWWLTGYPHNVIQKKPINAPAIDRAWTFTGQQNRGPMLLNLRRSLAAIFERVFCFHIDGAETPYKQLNNFIIHAKSGRAEAASGFHDDIPMSEAFAEEARKWHLGVRYTTGAISPRLPKPKQESAWAEDIIEEHGGIRIDDTDVDGLINWGAYA